MIFRPHVRLQMLLIIGENKMFSSSLPTKGNSEAETDNETLPVP